MPNHSSSSAPTVTIWCIVMAVNCSVISIIAGIVLLFSPVLGAAALWVLMGISLIVLGIVQVIRAFTFGKKD